MPHINLGDPKIYSLINSGMLTGVFQLDAPTGKQMAEKVRPTEFDDLIALNAIVRPGVKEADQYVDNKRTNQWSMIHPIVDEILNETYGALIYQEQTMLIMNRMTGGRWTLGKADSMRKVKNLEEYREDFVGCCRANNISPDLANTVFDRFDLGYSFNKSHACSYAVVMAQCAYLKAYYPAEFMAAVMTVYMEDDSFSTPSAIKECKRMGIKILPPDINESDLTFHCTDQTTIRYPLCAINKVGKSVATKILLVRQGRPFGGLTDFAERVLKKDANKGAVKMLIKAGCFDFQNINRNALLSLFSTLRGEREEYLTWMPEMTIQYEMETLGISLTRHPLDSYHSVNFNALPDGECTIACLINDIKTTQDRNDNTMAFLTVETKLDIIEVIVFSSVYRKFGKVLDSSRKVFVRGRKEGTKILANEIGRL